MEKSNGEVTKHTLASNVPIKVPSVVNNEEDDIIIQPKSENHITKVHRGYEQ